MLDRLTAFGPSLAIAAGLLLTCITSTPAHAQSDPQSSLDRVNSLFGEDYYAWFGSMYHRQSGGAYLSTSHRAQPSKYPPHIESTSKYTRVIEWSHQVDNTPQGLKDNTIGYVRPKQIGDPNHKYYGFFLDKNYPNLDPRNNGATVSEKKAARALGFSKGILKLFGSSPKYPLPSPDQNPDALSFLQSGPKFRTWLEHRNWNRSWTAGGDILQQSGAIKNLAPAKRTEILNTAWDYLKNQQQDADTGLWGNTGGGVDNDNPYIILNGAHKLVSFFRNFDHEVPNAEALKQTVLQTIENNNATNLLYTYNSSQLADDLVAGSDVQFTQAQLNQFLVKQAANLERFKNSDGGFGRAPQSPSDTDKGGLALKARDALTRLVTGKRTTVAPPAADTPLLYALSGENSQAKVTFDFENESLTAQTKDGLTASDFSATNTDGNNGPDNNGFHEEDNGHISIGHRGFGDDNSYYQFSVSPDSDQAVSLYFLALTARNGSGDGGENETLVVDFAVGQNPSDSDFQKAGQTTIPGDVFKTRDIPLSTFAELQGLDEQVSFRIYGKNFASDGRTFRLDQVQLFAVPEPGAMAVVGVGAAGLLVPRRRRPITSVSSPRRS